MSNPEMCARCGDFLSEEKLVLGGLALCRPCFEPRSVEAPPFVDFEEPRRYWVAAAVAFFGLMGLGFLAGIAYGPASDRVVDGLAGSIVGVFLGILAVALIGRCARAPWRREALARVGLDGVAPGKVTFVVFYPTKPRLMPTYPQREIGFVVEAAEGFVFLGMRGRRDVVRSCDIVAVRVAASRVRIDLRDGRICCLTSMELWNLLGFDRPGTKALADRIRPR